VNLLNQKRGLWAAALLRCRAAHLLPAGSIALAGLLASGSAVAQGTGVLQGRIVDASTKKPLGDVVVTATSPALQGEQTVVTDGSGQYRIPNLPPGDYSLRLDRDTYRPYARGGITMRSSSTIQVNAELLPEQVTLKAEEIVVVGKAPTVDVGSSSTGVSMNQDFTTHLPLSGGTASRSFEDLATVAPGAQADRFGVSVNGTTSPENSFVIDGVGVNNPAFGNIGTPLSVEFVKEFNVVSGGYMPEYGRSMGGIFEVVTQSGSNEFHGSVFFNITPGALEGPRSDVKRDGNTISTNPGLGSLRDFGATLGGPIIKDRIWFFGGVQGAFTRNTLERKLSQLQLDPNTGDPITDPGTGFTKTTPIPNSTKNYYADDRTIQYMGKLTFLFNQDHNISVSVYGTPTTSGGNGTFRNPTPTNIIGPYSAYAAHDIENSNDISLKYSGAFNNKHQLVDLTFGWHHQRSATLPNDDSEIGSNTGQSGIPSVAYRRSVSLDPTTIPAFHPITDFERVDPRFCKNITVPDPDNPVDDGMGNMVPGVKVVTPCPVTTYALGGFGAFNDSSIDSYQGKLIGTSLFTLAGHHVVKAGVDVQLATYSNTRAWSGGNIFRENGSGSNYADFRQYGFLKGPDDLVLQDRTVATTSGINIGGFLQDSWQIMDKVTLNFGIRYDTQVLYGSDGTVGLTLPNQWSPRVGAIYDFTQQGRSKIFAHFARSYEIVPLDIADRAFPGEVQAGARHASTDVNPEGCNPAINDPLIGYNSKACRGLDSAVKGSAGLGNTPNNPNQSSQRTGGDKVPVDPDISPQSSDQFVIGGEYEVFPDARVSVTYTHSYLNQAIEDMSNDEANTYFLGNPGYGIAKDFPKATRNYDSVTVAFQKAFANTWLAQASYTISTLRGNYSGLFRPENAQFDPNINSDFDLRSLLPNREGALPADRTHQIKLYGAKDFALPSDMNILVGLTFRTTSGTPLNYLGSHPLYGGSEAYILPRGSGGRGDWIHNFDLRLGYSVRLGKQSQIGFNVDVFNLFNFQGATSRDQIYTTQDVLPVVDGTSANLPTKTKEGKVLKVDGTPLKAEEVNPNFLNPTAFQEPRQFRFGAKVTF
jgi:outer membrane receptor protein involved in Fe transport